MACLIPRNSPFFPVSWIPRPENPRPPYKWGGFRGRGLATNADLFGLEQQQLQSAPVPDLISGLIADNLRPSPA